MLYLHVAALRHLDENKGETKQTALWWQPAAYCPEKKKDMYATVFIF